MKQKTLSEWRIFHKLKTDGEIQGPASMVRNDIDCFIKVGQGEHLLEDMKTPDDFPLSHEQKLLVLLYLEHNLPNLLQYYIAAMLPGKVGFMIPFTALNHQLIVPALIIAGVGHHFNHPGQVKKLEAWCTAAILNILRLYEWYADVVEAVPGDPHTVTDIRVLVQQ